MSNLLKVTYTAKTKSFKSNWFTSSPSDLAHLRGVHKGTVLTGFGYKDESNLYVTWSIGAVSEIYLDAMTDEFVIEEA